jgi:hypothetical protein
MIFWNVFGKFGLIATPTSVLDTSLSIPPTLANVAGDFIVEVIDEWHYGENTGAEPVELLVIDQVPEGRTTNTVLKP